MARVKRDGRIVTREEAKKPLRRHESVAVTTHRPRFERETAKKQRVTPPQSQKPRDIIGKDELMRAIEQMSDDDELVRDFAKFTSVDDHVRVIAHNAKQIHDLKMANAKLEVELARMRRKLA